LLVDREHSQSFRQILGEQNIKLLVAAPGRGYPAMENYLGFDEGSGAFFHLHVHYQLVLGEQFVKNYRLPFENDFLSHVQTRYDIKIPLPELEIVILAIRVLLKYRTRDFIKDIIPFRGPGLGAGFRSEIKWLLAQTSHEKIESVLNDWSHILSPNDILEFLQIAQKSGKAGFKIWSLKQRVRQSLGLFQRSNAFSASLTYARELWARRKFWRSSPITKMTFPEGGRTIAIIGADGAGKSTMTELLVKWLSWKLDIHTFYLGSKKPSHRSSFYYSLFRLMRRLTSWAGERNPLGKFLTLLKDIPLYMHHHSTGRDRYSRYIAGGKRALAGSLVLYDRYPLEVFNIDGSDLHEMDGVKIPSIAQKRSDPLTNWFIQAEQRLYGGILPPDCVIVLDVSPQVSALRKPDHTPAVLEAKIRGVRNLINVIRSDHKDVRLLHINADQPFNEVVLQLKKGIWSLL